MGVLPTKSIDVLDRLFVHGFVLMGPEAPVVVVAVDWCEIRNGAYTEWQRVIADAAHTQPHRVLVSSLHQHDAPVVDVGAAQLLADVGLRNELYDEAFHAATLERVANAVRASLPSAVEITQLGWSRTRIEGIASNRRLAPVGRPVNFARGSRSGGDPESAQAPEGTIDPYLATLQFYHGDRCVLELHSYATHPMSRYGEGHVSADFVGLARARRQQDDRSVRQIYVSGCSGDVTAGKFNDGSLPHREQLIDRLYQAMVRATDHAQRVSLTAWRLRQTPLQLAFHPDPELTEERLAQVVIDTNRTTEARILAAMGLSSRRRVARGEPIVVSAIDLGEVSIVLLPGESFVGLQLAAQSIHAPRHTLCIGYGECWPGYIPTESAFADGFHENWLWVAPGSEARIVQALETVLR